MEKLARKQVQELTPYLSARRIGGTGDVCSTPMNLHLIMSIKRILLA